MATGSPEVVLVCAPFFSVVRPFAPPGYQLGLTMPSSPNGHVGRGTPDVAGNGASSAGYEVFFQGKRTTLGGTSAVAPLFAGLFARINQRLASLGKPTAGFVNPLLYKSTTSFRSIVNGNNDLTGTLGLYHVAPGWDACTGLGAPIGTAIMEALGG